MIFDLNDEETAALSRLLSQTIDFRPLSALAAHSDLEWQESVEFQEKAGTPREHRPASSSGPV